MRYSFGLGESSLDHRRREEFPAIFTIMVSFGGVNERTLNLVVEQNEQSQISSIKWHNII